MTARLLFVGECRSLTAQRKGWTWADGRLAAKPLFEALAAMGVDPAAHEFINLWTDNATGVTPGCHGQASVTIPAGRVSWLRAKASGLGNHERCVVVALGKRVSEELAQRGIEHVALVHPAARGKIRKRERYIEHVTERLAPAMGRIVRIESTNDESAASWIERYAMRDKRGRYRVLKAIPGNGQYAPGGDEIIAWFRRLGVTHVEVAAGWHESVAAKLYALDVFAKILRRVSKGATS